MTNQTAKRVIILCIFFSVAVITFAADMYMWKDKDGKVRVTQTPPPEGATIIKVVRHPTPTPTATPYIPGGNVSWMRKPTPKVGSKPTVTPTETYVPDVPEASPTIFKDDYGHDEQWWQDYKQNLQSKITENQTRLDQIQRELYVLHESGYEEDDGTISDLYREQKRLKKENAEMEEELDELEYTVKKSGGLPGWVRD